MSNIIGTNISAPIVPFSSLDIYQTHLALYGHGGYRTVQNLTERDNITELRRENLMLVAVEYNSSAGTSGTQDAIIYQLKIDNGNVGSDSDLTNNLNWIEFETSGTGDTWILPPPVSSFDTGTPGDKSYDDDFIYICISENTWKRISMDYFSFDVSTSGTAGGSVIGLNPGDVPIFDGDTWGFDSTVRTINSTAGGFNVIYTDNTITNIPISASIPTQIISPDDKFLTAILTVSDGVLATNDTLTNTPNDGSYIAVFINGQEFETGNGVKTTSCYFSGDGGTSARGFSSSHPNGQVQTGDNLYWNGTISGTDLETGWRISFLYTVTTV